MKFHTANGFFACTTPLAALFVASITGCPVPPEEEEGSTFVGSETAATDTETDSAGSTDASSSDTGEEASCGNGKIDDDEGEECDLGSGNTDNGLCTSACKLGVCGDGLLLLGQEQCDGEDDCTADCKLASCSDGVLNGLETAIDCGGPCDPCGIAQACLEDGDCATGLCDDDESLCGYADSCDDIHSNVDYFPTGVYRIASPVQGVSVGYDVWCEMQADGGGWTLVMVSSDDGVDTWTWGATALMTNNDRSSVGNVGELNRDFKSLAYHEMPFSTLRFVHAPSDVAVMYAIDSTSLANYVGDGTVPDCTNNSGVALLDDADFLVPGTCYAARLTRHLGNSTVANTGCNAMGPTSAGGGYGLGWRIKIGENCDVYDGSLATLGPVNVVGMEDKESTAVGFGEALDLNWGTPGAAENYMQVYVR